jgi:hypothetical protein
VAGIIDQEKVSRCRADQSLLEGRKDFVMALIGELVNFHEIAELGMTQQRGKGP